MHPLVSVVIPAFNAAKFIVETIESVLKQTYQPIEIILVDDGSYDSTVSLVEENFGDRVRLVSQKNAGPSAARNRGICESSGKYIAFLDADDIWLPKKIEKQVAVMEKHPELGLICGDMIDFDSNGRETKSHFEKNGFDEIFFGDGLYIVNAFFKLFNKNFISTPTVILRRSILDMRDLFPLEFRFSEDHIFWLDLAKKNSFAYQIDVDTFRRKHENNLTNNTLVNLIVMPEFLNSISIKHGEYLKQLGIDIRDRCSKAWFDIGYYRLYELGQRDALFDFLKSIRHKPTWRGFLYIFATSLGLSRIVIGLRRYRNIIFR